MKPHSPVLPHSPEINEGIYAKDQAEYLPLAACNIKYQDGTISVITCWSLSLMERLRILLSGRFWLEQMTFGKPLQPIRPTSYEPFTAVDLAERNAAPLACNDSSADLQLLCRAAFDAPISAGNEMMYMPAGIHEITPTQDGKAIKARVLVTAEGASALETQRAALEAKGKRPYFDFNHEDGPASFWPMQFFW